MKPILILAAFIYTILVCQAQTFECGTSTVTDIDGNVYHTVQIGSQCWMKENMRTTRYSDGQPVGAKEITSSGLRETVNMPGRLQIQVILPGAQKLPVTVYDMTGQVRFHGDMDCTGGRNLIDCSIGPGGMYIVRVNGTSFRVMGWGGNRTEISSIQIDRSTSLKSDTIVISDTSRNYFDYDNDPALGIQYGKLYTARSALNVVGPPYPETIRGICPDGWHVANDADWMQLEITAGMTPLQAQQAGVFRGNIGRKLMITGSEWYGSKGTDDFGFSAKGSGIFFCNLDGCSFGFLRESCYWWTYNKDITSLMDRALNGNERGVWRGFYVMPWALSVRCVKNADE